MNFFFAFLTCLSLVVISLADEGSPGAVVVPASEHFEGNDGPWSTFDIRIGKPEQHLRVTVSTASPQTFVVLSDLGCSEDVFDDVPSDCAVSRGILFDMKDSSSWEEMGTYGINENGLGFQANLGYTQRAEWGLDELGIGLTGTRLKNQTIAAIATPEPFYLGLFGLNNQPVNFTSLGNSSTPSFLTTLKEDEVIPSLSWSYTAGARYRLKQVYGQLIFSGYDTSRFTENSVSFTMADDLTRDLVVGLQSISYSGSTSTTLLSEAIDIFIDSTDPNLWLPEDVCDAFEEAFGLTLDEESGLYLVNDTHRNNLLDSDAEVSFRLSDDKSGGESVSITLPYAAFDLQAEYPLVENSSYYFPLKRASNETQYTLGRVFFQEAYLSADYERKVFNVSACVWNSGAEENVVTITSKDSPDGSEGGGSSGSGSGGSGLGGGAIAGIVIGAVAGGILLALAVGCFCLRRRRNSKKRAYEVKDISPKADTTMVGGPALNNAMPYSSADVSGWSPSTTSPPRPVTVVDTNTSGSTPELDGRHTHVIPSTEIDGTELKTGKTPVARNPGVYELAGSKPIEGHHERPAAELLDPTSAVSSNSPDKVSEESPPSPYVSTMGTNWDDDERRVPDFVSPTNTAYGHRPY